MDIFRRKAYDRMLEWKANNGRYALMIEGARRTGKTTIATEFAKKEYRSHIVINFSVPNEEIENLFKDYGKGADRFFLRLQEITNVHLHPRESVIIFDEVQKFPLARQLIKQLVEDGRYDYIETGSLISIKKNVEDIVIPSEEMPMELHPMDFEEFLWAMGNETTVPLIRECFAKREPLGFDAHRRIMDLYTTYMIVGGMPQAVASFLEDNNFESVEKSKRTILNLYRNDAVKINARRILTMVPAFLSRHEKTFSPGMVRKGSATRDYLDAVEWLGESKMINICIRSSDPGPAVDLTLDESSFKMYMLDTGLMITQAFITNVADRRKLYDDLLRGRLNVNLGMVFENMVAQELTMTGHSLVFAKFEHDDSNYLQEVDFVIPEGGKVIPVECKSGVSTRHVSLDRFLNKYGKSVKHAYVVHGKDLRVDGDITYIPIYMTMFI